MGLFDLPRTEWVCKNPECKGATCSDGEAPKCHDCGAEMKINRRGAK